MPQLLQTISEIVNEKQRDVLWVAFCDLSNHPRRQDNPMDSPRRQALIEFLDAHRIPWRDCFEDWGPGWETYPFYGSIYLDVPYDLNSDQYQVLARHLENADGTPRLEGVHFVVTRHEQSRNAVTPPGD